MVFISTPDHGMTALYKYSYYCVLLEITFELSQKNDRRGGSI